MASLPLSFSLSYPAPALLSSTPSSSAITLPTRRMPFLAPQSFRRRSYIAQMSKMIDQEVINQPEVDEEVINQPEVFRPLGNFSPSIWGDTFANYTLDTELWKKYSKEVAELKEKVRSILIVEEHKVSEKINLIDALERLGVAYHFEDDIEQILQQLFHNYDYNENYDLYNVALHFRIFRQHGHDMSSDIFRKYRESDGKLYETLEKDVRGMLSLYEAANLAKHGEDILDEALDFTKTRLRNLIPKLSSYLAEEVKRSLDCCLHRRLPRIEARNYIEAYGSNPLRNETLLYFAKIDFNLVQMLHRQELSTITKWWNDKGAQLPHVRDRLNEVYFWCLLTYFEPHHAVVRITYAKFVLLQLLLDDTYDSYGTVDELKLLTDAIEMWDANAIHLIPDYLKIVYKSLLNIFEEFNHQFMGNGGYRGLSCLKHATQKLVRSYLREAKWWFKGEKIPSFDEYLANGFIFFTSTVPIILGVEAVSNEEVFGWLQSEPKILIYIAIIWRLTDDIETYEVEKAKGQSQTGIECFMNQYGVSKEDTIQEFNHMIDKAWKGLNEEYLKSTQISKHLMDSLINSARIVFLYRGCDAYTNPEISLKGLMVPILLDRIPLV